MKKPMIDEARDQCLHALAGAMLTLAFAFIGIGVLWLPGVILGIALVREWLQHDSIYLPRGGSLVDIIFFGVGSLIACLIIGGTLWTQSTP